MLLFYHIKKKKSMFFLDASFPPNFLVAADVRTSIHSILLALHLAHVSLPVSTLTIWREEQTDLHLKCSYLWRPLLPFRQPKSTNWKGQECRGRRKRCVCVWECQATWASCQLDVCLCRAPSPAGAHATLPRDERTHTNTNYYEHF